MEETYFGERLPFEKIIIIIKDNTLKDPISIKISLRNYIQVKVHGGPQKCPYFSLTITFTKIRKPSRFFLHKYWKFIEFFW